MTEKLVAVKKENGFITHFLTDEHRMITLEEAQQMARGGELDSLTDLHADGRWEIHDGEVHKEGNNLADLPEF
ncbi:hypothetical protein [Ammoniphilus resinae]|uniref:DUF3892 domain-containing protein n=1 Tax=Ammoniphilus resinae TaxID=861532 RepID=A0ABS4GM81_9BACL|nr:hypothetical protein [Ammoniphilus resinae]MBP1931177.1 hypothetical protein [Ammoniphilus resinae]